MEGFLAIYNELVSVDTMYICYSQQNKIQSNWLQVIPNPLAKEITNTENSGGILDLTEEPIWELDIPEQIWMKILSSCSLCFELQSLKVKGY